MKKVVLVLSTLMVSLSSFAISVPENVMSQDTTNNSKTGRKTGTGTSGTGSSGTGTGSSGTETGTSGTGTGDGTYDAQNRPSRKSTGTSSTGSDSGTYGTGNNGSIVGQDSMNRTRTGGKMSQRDRDMNRGTMGDQKMGGRNSKMNGMSSDGIMMKDGKVMITQNGKTMPLENELTLENGTKVMMDGTYMDKNGSTMRMKNGDHMNMAGKMMPMKRNKMK